MKTETKRTPVSSIGIGKLRRALLMSGSDGLTIDEIAHITGYANSLSVPPATVGGAGIKLERVRISRAGDIVETCVYRLKNGADALALILFANRCADAYGYDPITNDEAISMLELYPGNTA